MTDHVTLMREHAAQLRAQADRYDQAIRLLEGDVPPIARSVKVRAPAGQVPKGADLLARNKRTVEAKGLVAAAAELGLNYATLYGQATRLGWKIPKVARVKQPTGKALEKVAIKEATGALRRCERCEQMTRSNPCQHCGHAWKREK